jgi:hypothetical protein
MKKLQGARRDDRMLVQNPASLFSDCTTRTFGLITRHPSLPMDFWSQKKVFLEKRTQTLPVIIDDREKTNPKRTQIKP